MARRRTRSPIPVPGAPHGSTSGYNRWECGCDPCLEASRMANRRVLDRRKATATIGENGRPRLFGVHGTPSLYAAGCRCDPCTDANTKAKRDLRHRRRQEAQS